MSKDLNALATQIIKAVGIPDEEVAIARGLLEKLEPGPAREWLVLVTWTVMSIKGLRDDTTKLVGELQQADFMTIKYIKEILSQADQLQGDEMLPKQSTSPGDDPHG